MCSHSSPTRLSRSAFAASLNNRLKRQFTAASRPYARMGGRPPLLDNRQIIRMIEMYDEQKNTVSEICKIYDISRPSFYNYLKNRKMELAKNNAG